MGLKLVPVDAAEVVRDAAEAIRPAFADQHVHLLVNAEATLLSMPIRNDSARSSRTC